ncbi:MAG: NAD(P)/FAD-dependent oxidoreductase [Nitrososphaeria archaeon]|nr:FAD-dependent oxidoreductase [Conexivisphaerales archaeon]
MYYDYAVIGGGVAGYFAVKELAGKGKVIMISDEPDLPYDRPPLSKEYLRGEKNAPFFEKPDFYSSNGITVLLNEETEKIEGNSLITSSGLRIRFKKALIATGGRPKKLGVPGENKRGVYYLRTLRDATMLRMSEAKKVVIIGGGFIGVEAAASLKQTNREVTVVEAMPRILSKFSDADFSSYVEGYLKSRGIEILTGETVESINGSKQVEGVKLKGGKEIKADAVLVAVGIKPSVELALNSGIRAGDGIDVDEYLRTSAQDVYAAGDVAMLYNKYIGEKLRIEHWNNAQYTGVLAARNMLGSSEAYDFFSTIWSDLFDLHIESGGSTKGWDEKATAGNPENGKFVITYMKEKRTIGYIAVNVEWEKLEALNDAVKNKKEIKADSFLI